MPHDPTIQNLIRKIALEQRVSLSDARRILIEQIDCAKRKRVQKAGYALTASRKKVSSENPHRRLVSTDSSHSKNPKNPTKNGIPVNRNSNTREPESLISLESTLGTPTLEKPEREKTRILTSTVLEPTPGTDTAIIHGIIRDAISFEAAENKLMGLKRFENLTRSAVRQRMYAVVDRYALEVK